MNSDFLPSLTIGTRSRYVVNLESLVGFELWHSEDDEVEGS